MTARVGYREGRYLRTPTAKDRTQSQLHLVVAGTEHAVLMVESEAKGLSEEIMLGAVVFGHEQMQPAIRAIRGPPRHVCVNTPVGTARGLPTARAPDSSARTYSSPDSSLINAPESSVSPRIPRPAVDRLT